MVFAHLTAYLLDKYLGDYIENLDSKQLKIDLWNGDVTLKDLSLKPDALANLDLPVTVAAGYLQKLSLHIPWKHLYTHPTKITIEGLYLLVTPKTDVHYNAERDEQSQYQSKMKEVLKVEQFRREREEYENSQNIAKHKDTFLERLGIHILRNLELSISNIHIAFEDNVAKPERPFSFGITLNYLKIFTTNTEWEPVVSKEESPVIYKLGELDTLAIYWNSNVKVRSQLTTEDIVDILQANILPYEQRIAKMTYVLRPLNIKARLKIATAPSEQDYQRPVFDAQIDLEQINLNINRQQYADLLDLLEFQDQLSLKSKYIKYYATLDDESINKRSVQRWKFAYNAILHEEVRPRLSSYKWENIKTNLENFRDYHKAYFELLDGGGKKQKQKAEELEKKIDAFNLLYIRRTVEIEIKKKKAEHKEQSWWERITGWWNGDSETSEYQLDNIMGEDEKKKLYDAIGYVDEKKSLAYPEEYEDVNLSVRLNMLEINVWSNINENDTKFQIIASAAVPDAGLAFKRRPAKSAFLLVVDITSFQVFGIQDNTVLSEASSNDRPILAQNRISWEQKSLLHIEYETFPLHQPSENRIQVIAQSMEITYDAFTINKLIECFQSERKHDLTVIKEIAYSTFNDLKYRSHFLFNHYLKNIQAMDIDIDFPSSYLILPDKGFYRKDCPVLCLDFGHLTFKGGPSYTENGAESGKVITEAANIDQPPQSQYFPLKLRWEAIQLIYGNQNDEWYNARMQCESPLHLIKPISLAVDIHKCIYPDNTVLPAWKIDAQLSPIDGRVSDAQILAIVKLIQSIPFPESEENDSVEEEILVESTKFKVKVPRRNTKKTLETVENMTSVQTSSEETSSAEGEENQVVELEAKFELPRIDFLIEESSSTQPFLRLSIVALLARATMKTYDIDFDVSLTDLIVTHEQFITTNNDRLRLISTEHPNQLIRIHGLLTSPVNPSFSSSPYNGIENQISIEIGKPILMLQLEALQSIVQFEKDLMENIPRQSSTKKSNSPPKQIVKKDPTASAIPTFQFDARLQGLRAIIGSEYSQILDIQLDELRAFVLNSKEKTTARIVLTDFYVYDPNRRARFHKIISQQGDSKELLRLDFTLFNYPKRYEKTLDDIDCDLQLQLTKINVIFLYKHIDLITTIANMFETKAKKSSSSSSSNDNEPGVVAKFQEQAKKLRLNVTLNAPSILIPINSYSNEGLFLDLGQLTVQTRYIAESRSEEQNLTIEHLLITRVKLNSSNEILADISLFECAQLTVFINRLLSSNEDSNQSPISIKAQWDTIEFILAKDDYRCLMKIIQENFSEKISHKLPKLTAPVTSTPSQEKIVVSNNKKSDDQITSEQLRFDAEIKKISLTLYLGETNIKTRQTKRNENLKFVDFRLEMLEARFRQLTDSSYTARVELGELRLDDLREPNRSDRVMRLIDRGFKVDPKTPIFTLSLDFKPKNELSSMAIRQINGQLESFYICMTPDYIMALQDFFVASLSMTNEKRPRPPPISSRLMMTKNNLPLPAKSIANDRKSEELSSAPSETRPSTVAAAAGSTEADMETLMDLTIKTSEIILLEDQHNPNSNCLVLDLNAQVRMVIVGDNTKLSGSVKDLTIFGSNFGDLKKEKVKYRILQPLDIDAIIIMTTEQQKIDVRIGDIAVSIPPIVVHTIRNVVNSLGKLQTSVETEADEINSKTIFAPKPFKDANFWFVENNDKKQELLEQTDILEVTTGTPSHHKPLIDEAQKEKEKAEQPPIIRTQELMVNLKIIEVKMELGTGSVLKPVIAMCLSDIFLDVKNWSSDMIISSKLHLELALFNDNLLAWEPLIEPVINEKGEVVCPWCITCSTARLDEEEENDEESRFLLEDPKSSSSTTEPKEEKKSLEAKQMIYIRAEHLLNLTVTKTMVGLAQRLSSMFEQAYKHELKLNQDDEDQSMLTVLNMTGGDVQIESLHGVQFLEGVELKTPLYLPFEDSLGLTVPKERLSATHIPAIAEQMSNRRQEFSVKFGEQVKPIDINQTWRRVFEFGPSPIPNWPIQLLCDSHLYNGRRRIVFSSIIKIFNRATMPIMLLDVDSVETGKLREVARIEPTGEYYLPLSLLYVRTTPRLFISIDDASLTNQGQEFISFDWETESSADRVLKMKNGKDAHFVFYKEAKEAYSENTDEPTRTAFHVYVKLALHLINLLSLDVQCWIDNIEQMELKPSQLYHSVAGGKKSVLTFVIPCYNDMKWTSEPLDLNSKSENSRNDHVIIFHSATTSETLRLLLRVDTYRSSYRVSLYSPYWVVNCTDLKFEFKIEHEKTLIEKIEPPFFICPKHFDNKKKKGHIRVFSPELDETVSEWSEGFSLDVIKATGITSCKVANDRTYLISIDTVTTSFGMTKIITLAPSTLVINKSTVEVEVTEAFELREEEHWKSIKPEGIVPFWPRDLEKGLMRVRYTHNRLSTTTFRYVDKQRMMLRMEDDQRPALQSDVVATDYDGFRIVFGDYKNNDSPVLLVNCLPDRTITFCQTEDIRAQILPPQHYVYFTWCDPLKPQSLLVSSNSPGTTIELTPLCGRLKTNDQQTVYYTTFLEGSQMVMLFTDDVNLIDTVTNITTVGEKMHQHIQIGLRDIGIAVIDDVFRNDLFYISISPSKEIWTETRQFRVRPLSSDLSHKLEENYKSYQKEGQGQLADKKYRIDDNRDVSFDDDTAEVSDHEGHRVQIQRQALDGLWFGFAWSTSNQAVHLRVNRIQIDNEHEFTLFPVVLNPIVSKASGTDIPGKPFIEFSLFKTAQIRSNTQHVKYAKLLIQEFVFAADSTLIMSILKFVKTEKVAGAPTIDMEADLKRIHKPLEALTQQQSNSLPTEPKIFFDNLHLSPIKVHVSFSIHGSTSPGNDQLLAEYPLVDFLLQTLNVAEVQDVVLKLNYYERKNEQFTMAKLIEETENHFQNQLMRQLHVVVLGLDVLGNPFGVIRGVAEGVQSFFYEPYKGAMEGPIEFIEGIATGTRNLVGSAVGGAAGAVAKISGVASKGLATLTFDQDYQNARLARKEVAGHSVSDVFLSGKNIGKDVVHGVKGVVKKPVAGAKQKGTTGFFKGLGKGFLGLVVRPASGVADFASTSFDLIKRVAVHEGVVHRVRSPRHVGRDGIIRPSTAHETRGFYILDHLDDEKHGAMDTYIAHMDCSEPPSSILLATAKRLLFLTARDGASDLCEIHWECHYKDLKGAPSVKFEPNEIEITFKEPKLAGLTKKDRPHDRTVPYRNAGEARYIVDKITQVMRANELKT